MYDFTFYALNSFMIFFLISFFLIMVIKKSLHDFKGKLFTTIVVAIIVMLSFEILSLVFDNKPGELNYVLNIIFNSLFTAFGTIVVSLWFSYLDYFKYESKSRLRNRLYYMYPTIILIVLVIINLFKPILFTVSDNNVYQRLPLIYISIVMALIMYIYIVIKVYQEKDNINKNTTIGILIFLLFPLIAAVVQLHFFGLMLMWPATAVSLVLSFILIETTTKDVDYLTQVSSRKVAEERITYFLEKKKEFSVIMIDIDKFKELNDNYGHNEGDNALKALARALLRTFDKKDVVSRFGGDEFIMVIRQCRPDEIEAFKIQTYKHLKENNNKQISELQFSLGYIIVNNKTNLTKEEIIIKADNKMYEDKEKNKRKLSKSNRSEIKD